MAENNQNRQRNVINAALALRKNIVFTFKGKNFQIPNVINDRYIVGDPIDEGGFGSIFACSDS